MKTTLCLLALLAGLTTTAQILNAQVRTVSSDKSSGPGASMTAEEKQNLASAKRYATEYLTNGNVKAADELADPGVQVVTGLSPKAPIDGLANHKKIFLPFNEAFPATAMTIEDSFAADNRVMLRVNWLTTFKKDYFGVKATGKPVRLIETHVFKFNKEGKIIEDVVSATNLEWEMIFAPVLSPMILGDK
jgi:predicted ester cyclase